MLPAGLCWDHNAHYHPWLLRQLPKKPERALDIGCGLGTLARALRERAGHVDAVDLSEDMTTRAQALGGDVRWVTGDVLELEMDTYDVVTAVSSLHHMPLRPALARMAELVRPGGTLVVIGHYRIATAGDWAVEPVNLLGNAVVGAFRRLKGLPAKDDGGMPVTAPATTLPEIREAAAELLPGARVRRRLFWRYSLVWHKAP